MYYEEVAYWDTNDVNYLSRYLSPVFLSNTVELERVLRFRAYKPQCALKSPLSHGIRLSLTLIEITLCTCFDPHCAFNAAYTLFQCIAEVISQSILEQTDLKDPGF